jgi:cation transport regulator
MPYSKISELPDRVKTLPTAAQKQFLKVVNSALDSGDSEERAFKKAWGVIKKNYKKEGGKWVKAEDVTYFVPFSEREDGWYLYFPVGTVYHYGKKIEFTQKDAQEMVTNFQVHNIPDYDLPVNILHRDEYGVYGYIDDLRFTGNEVQWKPHFREEKIEEIKDKGYRYASPEVRLRRYQALDGDYYDNVALGIALTPRPRLGRATAIFSDDQGWETGEEDKAIDLLRRAYERLSDMFGNNESEEKHEAQKTRSEKYNIAILEHGHLTKPAKWEDLSDDQFADPVNYRYPIHDKSHVQNASSRFAQEDFSYKGKNVVEKRIEDAKKKFKVGEYREKDDMSDIKVEELAQNIADHLSERFPEQSIDVEALSEQLKSGVFNFEAKVTELEEEVAALREEKEKAEAEAAKFAEEIKMVERKRRAKEFSDKAEELGLPVENGGDLLMYFHDADDTEDKARYAELESLLEAMGNIDETGRLFDEMGSGGPAPTDPVVKFEALVEKHQKEHGASVSEATVAVAEAHPEIYAEYDAAVTRNGSPKQED